MRESKRPEIVGNIQPFLTEYLYRFGELIESKNQQSIDTNTCRMAVVRTEIKIKALLGEILPTHRFPLIVPIKLKAGAIPVFPLWHSDNSGLALASSHLVTEFLEGKYDPISSHESGEEFSSRIDLSTANGDLVRVAGIESGDVILSSNDKEHSALHRAVPNTTTQDIIRVLVTGSLLRQ